MTTPLRHTPLLEGNLFNLFYPPRQYTYFARAKDVPFVGASPAGKAAWAVDAAMLAYARYGENQMSEAELKENFDRAGLQFEKIGGTPTNWNAPGTQAVFAACSDFAILAFRGTEKDDPDDLLTDADLILWHEPDYRHASDDPGLALGGLSFVTHLFADPCFVHRGFQLALNSVWKQVHRAVTGYRRQHPGAEICFTGHSLGGALAVLAFSRLADPALSLYTFGCPRVGDGSFRDRVLSNPGHGIHRYVNFNDAVTHVPTDSLFYRQTPETCHRFDEAGNLGDGDGSFQGDIRSLRAAFESLPASIQAANLETIPAPASLVDHSPARYAFRIWDCV